MGEINLRQIDSFLDSIYQNLDSESKEVQELKLEMKSHLLKAVYELKLAGKTEQEAIKMAIARFGGEKEIRIELGKWFNKRKKLTNLFHFCALIILLSFS